MELVYASIAGFFAAVIGALGMGGGGILLIYLTAVMGVPQMKAQGINLVFFIPIAVLALFVHAKNKLLAYKLALIGILSGAVGVFAGFAVARFVGDYYLSKAFGVFLLIFGVRELFGDWIVKRRKKRGKHT